MKPKSFTIYVLLFFLSIFAGQRSYAGVIPVTVSTDNVAGSLRAAISLAAAGDTIVFDNLLDGVPILVATSIDVNKSLTIMGNGNSQTVLSGGNVSSIFSFGNDAEISISGMQFQNAMSMTNGGAIEIGNASVFIQSSTFVDNRAMISGGALSLSGGTLRLENVTFESNTAAGMMATNGGGAIVNLGGTLEVAFCSFDGNQATGASGSGGAILNLDGGNIIITGGTFTQNTALRAGGALEDNAGATGMIQINGAVMTMNSVGSAPGNGGAIHITGAGNMAISGGLYASNTASAEGGALWNGTGTMTLDSVRIENNIASGAAADNGGGGVFNAGGMLMIRNNTFITGNKANGTSGSGGGILNDVGGTLSISNATITGNSSSRAGGGIEDVSGDATLVSLINVDFEDNDAGMSPGNGGAIHISGNGNITIEGGSVQNNLAVEGGGFWNNAGVMTVVNVEFDGNIATGNDPDQGGGALYNNGGGTIRVEGNTIFNANLASGSAGSGGAILNNTAAILEIAGASFTGNVSNRAGGAIEDVSGVDGNVSLSDCVFTSNDAGNSPGNGGAIHISGAGNIAISGGSATNNLAVEGGAFWNGAGLMTVTNVTFTGNVATGNDMDQGGGALYNNGAGIIRINGDTEFTANRASGTSGSGGAIFNNTDATLEISGATFRGNISNRAGGAIEDVSGVNGTVSLDDCLFVANDAGTSPGNGGAIHITGAGNIEITGGVVENNLAVEGGGFWNGSGMMTIMDVEFSGNVASGAAADQGGGALYNNGSGTIQIGGNTAFDANLANGTSGSGGAIFNNIAASLEINGANFTANASSRAGGAIEDQSGVDGMITLSACNFMDNDAGTSPGNGGAIHITGPGNIAITGGMVSGNLAVEGGGFWNGSGLMTISAVTFENNIATGNDPDQGGGALYNNGAGTIRISSNTNFSGNRANGMSGSGGAIFNNTDATLEINGSNFMANFSNRAGGAIEDAAGVNGTVVLVDCNFMNNNAGNNPGNGGAVHITGEGQFSLDGGILTGNVAGGTGGALWNGTGLMELSSIEVAGNTATVSGGGIYNVGGAIMGQFITVAENMVTTAMGTGGGVHNTVNGNIELVASTISGNMAMMAGGGIHNEGMLAIENCTVFNNQSQTMAGGLVQNQATANLMITGSIVAGNDADTDGKDLMIMGNLTSNGYNLIGIDNNSLFATDTTNISGSIMSPANPMLDTLADNGGMTRTHALVCGSAAINNGNPDNNRVDQRGMDVFDGRKDIGAFEYQDTCAITSEVTVLGNSNEVNLYPNPVNNQLTVTLEFGIDKVANWRIAELSTGKTKMNGQTGSGQINIAVNDLPSGTYLFELSNGNQRIYKKFVVID